MTLVYGPLGNRNFTVWRSVGVRGSTVSASVIEDLTAWTWEFWYRPGPTPPPSGYFWQLGAGGGFVLPGMQFGADGSSRITIDNQNAAGSVLSTTILQPNTWTHIAGTYSAGTLQLLINGILEDSDTGLSWASRELWLQPSGGPTGEYCDPRCWNFARSAAQITADHGDRLTGTESGLVGYWPGDGSGNSTPNIVTPGTADMQSIGGGNWTWVFASQPTVETATAPLQSVTASGALTAATAGSSTAIVHDGSPDRTVEAVSPLTAISAS